MNRSTTRLGAIDLGVAISDAWNAATEQWGVAVLATLVASMVLVIPGIIIIPIFIIGPVLAWGFTALLLNMLDGQDAELGDTFSGFGRFGDAWVNMGLYYLITLLLNVPQIVLNMMAEFYEMPGLMILGYLISFTISFLVLVRLYMAPFYIVDQNMGAMEAMSAAWQATSNQRLMVIVLSLVASIISFAGFLAFCIGILFSYPLSQLIWAAAYRQLEPLDEGTDAPAPPPPNQGAFNAPAQGQFR